MVTTVFQAPNFSKFHLLLHALEEVLHCQLRSKQHQIVNVEEHLDVLLQIKEECAVDL